MSKMTPLALKSIFIVLFVLWFSCGVVIGFLGLPKFEANTPISVFMAAVFIIIFGGSLSLFERRYLWQRFFKKTLNDLQQQGSASGGLMLPISTGLGLGLLCGWMVAVQGLPV